MSGNADGARLTEEALALLGEFYEANKDTVEAIIQSGSSCLPWIADPRDVDVLVVFKTYEYGKSSVATEKLNALRAAIAKVCPKVAILRMYVPWYCLWITGDYERYSFLHRDGSRLPPYVYVYRYSKTLFGEDTSGITKIDLLGGETRSRYIDSLSSTADFIGKCLQGAGRAGVAHKCMYHLLTGLAFLENGSYDLSDAQAAEISAAHNGFVDVQSLHEAQVRLNAIKKAL